MRASTVKAFSLIAFSLAALLCSVLLHDGVAGERPAERSDSRTTNQITAPVSEDVANETGKEAGKESGGQVHKEAAKEASEDTVEVAKHAYAGVSKCKMCHMPYFKAWSSTPHAKALDALDPEKKQDKNPKCLKCHTTGLGRGGYEIGKKTSDFAGVQCEACHGAGADYKTVSIMKDIEKAKAAGLVTPVDESVCVQCHNEESPNFEGFDFKEYMAKGVHEIEEKKGKEAED